jgi:hypothetical protein
MLLSTPGGILSTGRTEERWPPEFMRMIALLAETSADIDIGLHCSRCKENLVGRNAREDRQWRLECACRTFVGANPLPKGN